MSARAASPAVHLPCGECGAMVLAHAAFDTPARRDLIRCAEHMATLPEPRGLTLSTAWANRVPMDARNARIDAITDESTRLTVAEAARTWPGRGPDVLTLMGSTGIGKTCAAYALLTQLVTTGRVGLRDVTCLSELDASEQLSQQSKWLKTGRWRDVLGPATVVLLDDVGFGRYFDAEIRMAVWKDLLDHVSARRRVKLILTTNLTPDGLRAHIGGPQYSRLTRASVWRTPGTVDRRHVGQVSRATR